MSNCIEIKNHLVTFTGEEIDIEKFKKIAEEHKNHPRTFNEMKVEDAFCWFIRDNHVVRKDSVKIRFGKGASSHTWRDFAQTINLLQSLMKKERVHFFVIADEGGYERFSDYKVTFGRKYDKYLKERGDKE